MGDKRVDEAIDRALKGADRYFMGTHEVQKTADSMQKLLREAGIDFAIAGALAVNAHGVSRMTEDVDLLLTREGLARFKELWLGGTPREIVSSTLTATPDAFVAERLVSVMRPPTGGVPGQLRVSTR